MRHDPPNFGNVTCRYRKACHQIFMQLVGVAQVCIEVIWSDRNEPDVRGLRKRYQDRLHAGAAW